jgi:uncharacterized protein
VLKGSVTYCLLIVLTLLTLVALFYLDSTQSAPGRRLLMPNSAKAYTVREATTPAEQEQGLSDLERLPQNEGMLFVGDDQMKRCFWMKDMRFAIDIIWVASDKRITHIEESVKPSTYPDSYCATGQYVIELNAGEADKNSLRTGQQLSF